jgi:hypothetical protein
LKDTWIKGNKKMERPIKSFLLANKLSIHVYDQTKRYYEGFHLVKLEMVCEVLLVADYFQNVTDFSEAKKMLGEKVVYRRVLEHMGVPFFNIDDVQQSLLQNFATNSLPYFELTDFPQKIVFSELARERKRAGLKSA